jgi:hypothetical protein
MLKKRLPWKQAMPTYGIPTVNFDPSRVTKTVKEVIREAVESIPEFDKTNRDVVYEVALQSVSVGRDLKILFDAIIRENIEGMSKRRASDISLFVNNRATSVMERERLLSVGIGFATWRSSRAPCMSNVKKPSSTDLRQDAAHKNADGHRFQVAKGMFIDGKWTWPSYEHGCKCILLPIVKGFESAYD